MAQLTEVVEGWTGRLTFQLYDDGAALNGTGLTVTALDLVGNDGVAVTTTADFGWLVQASGTVYYDPDAADLTAARSPYKVRYQITDGSGAIVWYPNGAPDTIAVHRRGIP
jgi:hypothetical protein